MSALENPAVQPLDDELPIDLGAMWDAVWSHKIVLAIGLLLGAVGSVVFAFMQPVYYTAQVRVMPPSSQSGGGSAAMLAALGGLGGLGGGAASALGIKNPGDLYVGLLKSRSIADAMIEQFNLKTVYEQKTMQETRTELLALTKAASGKDGIITIDVDDQDPKRAASMANAYFKSLQDMMQRMATTEAGQRRLFFENQLKQAKNNLTDAEEGFKGMQQKTGVLQLDAQGKVAIESVARIRAAIAAKEVELAAIRQFATPENPQYQRPATELNALRGELAKLERAQTGAGMSVDGEKAGKRFTDSGVEYVRRLRDLKYAETMFELMAKQFEFARVDEAKETSSLQLIDSAVVPELKSRPKRSLMIVGGLFLSLMLVVGFILFRTRKQWFGQAKLA